MLYNSHPNNVAKEPGEAHDLTSEYPGKLKELCASWRHLAKDADFLTNRYSEIIRGLNIESGCSK